MTRALASRARLPQAESLAREVSPLKVIAALIHETQHDDSVVLAELVLAVKTPNAHAVELAELPADLADEWIGYVAGDGSTVLTHRGFVAAKNLAAACDKIRGWRVEAASADLQSRLLRWCQTVITHFATASASAVHGRAGWEIRLGGPNGQEGTLNLRHRLAHVRPMPETLAALLEVLELQAAQANQ